jgi:2-polyprenyl-6-methoxyphenol hydroxylase-like FAD-dependent oxidoreductase
VRSGLNIAIAGAGPGGLATALMLARLGHRVRLFERFETPRPLGSGLMLQPTGLAVLETLGLRADIGRLGSRVDRLLGTDARSGRKVLDVSYRPLGPDVHALAVHRSALFTVLHNAVVAQGIEIVVGFPATEMSGAAPGYYLHSDKGRHGPFDLIVDATGSSSPLRRFARHKPAARPLEFGALWATLPWVEPGFDRHALVQRYHKASVMIGVLPAGKQVVDGPDLAAFFWSFKTADHDAVRRAGIESWRSGIRQHWPETEPHLANIVDFDQLSLARYSHATLKTPAGEGIAFVGDSAHSTSPQLGQGANMALLDAAALAFAIESAADISSALAAYVQMRRWHVRLYQVLSSTLTPLYQSDSTIYPVLRDLGAGSLARIPPLPWLLAKLISGQLLLPRNPLLAERLIP